MTASSSLESLEFLFQKRSQTSNQISPHAPFAVASAVNGGEAFQSQLAPDQKPKKRKILLDFNSCYRLWNPNEMALEIAKLKNEEFEIAFILKGEREGEIFESLIEDKAEGDKKYDYKFKDKEGNDKSIFELSDDYIKKNFSKLDHEKGIEKLGLVRDESIILSYEQFDKVDKIFKQEYWANKERDGSNSALSYSLLKKPESYILTARPNFTSLVEFFNHKEFNKNYDKATIRTSLKNFHNYTTTLAFLSRLNEEKLVDLFDIFSEDKESISIQKSILEKLWFECSNFENVVKKAKTLDEFKDKEAHEIATSILGNSPSFWNLISKPGSFDILERLSEESAFPIFTSNTDLYEISKYSVIAQQKINQTSFGEKIKVDFTLLNNDAQGNFIEFSLQLSENNHKESLTLWSFIQIFSNPESNQQFNLTEQFGDAIIKSLETKDLLKFCDSFTSNSASNFLEQLNDNQKTRFLDLLQNKITNVDASSIIDDEKLRVLKTLQHFLDQPKILDFAKSILNSNSNPDTKLYSEICYHYLNPAFQDLLLEMHEESEIDLNKFDLPQESKLFAKFRKDFLYSEAFAKYDVPRTLEESKTSPVQISIYNFNYEALTRIKNKINSGELDASKILSVNVFAFKKKKQDDKIEDSLIPFCKLFPNLKCARIDIKDQNYNNLNYDNFLLENLPTLRIISDQTIAQFSATKTGDKIYMGNSNSSGASKQDSPAKFSMKETGEIIQRPTHNQASLYIRYASRKLNLDFAKLQDNLFVDIDESQAISSAEITKFLQPNFDAKKTELESSDSSEKTICSFSRNLQANAKNILPSISPNNKIIGYYTEPDSAKVEFFKDEKSGFYYAKTATECKIHYLIEGRELELQTPIQTTSELPDKIKEIIAEYVGENPAIFPLSVKHDDYELPAFSNKKQFLDELFNLKNKGSCRHRVASLAHEFEKKNLKCGEDFRIIGIDGNHVLLEVKKQDNTWATLDLGGEESILEKASKPNPPLVLAPPNPLPIQLSMSKTLYSSAGSDGQSGGQNYGVTSIFTQCMSCLGFGAGVVKPNQEQSYLTDASSTSELIFSSEQQRQKPEQKPEITTTTISLEELAKIQERKLQNLKIFESALAEIHQLKKVEDLESFKTDFEKFATENKSSALLLKTTRGEELKNYLLRMSSSSQNPPSPSDYQSTSTATPNTTALTSSALSFQAFYVSSPQDLTAKKPTLHIGDENKTVKITANTPLLSFLENAKQHNDKQHVLIIDWGKFDASSQVAFNTMFDKGSRKIDDQEIPDNVKIVCIDSSKQKTTDSSILSRFGKALDLSSIPKNQFTKSPSETSSRVREISEIACDGEGLVNWKEKLFGRIIVDGDVIKWEKSDFVKSLEAFAKEGTADSNPDQPEQKDLHINFKNFSLTQQQEMKIFFEQAKSRGSIDYHDYKITIPQDLSINFTQKEFEFTEVLKSFKPADSGDSLTSTSPDSNQLRLNIYKNSLASNQLPTDIHLINSHLFDQLLTQPQIEENQYREELGLIAKAKESSSPLKLFLSENLTKQQLYCLLNQAQEHQVALELYLAKGAEIPKVDLKKFTQEFGLDKGAELTRDSDQAGGVGFSAIRTLRESSPSPESSRIIITNNIEESLNKTITAIESANSQPPPAKTINLVNVEDILYGDLFGKTQHKIVTKEDGSQHFAFEKIETAIKTKLEAGETVILKGEFSAELLSLLHPQILNLQEKFSNLHFIIEDKNVSKFRPQSSKLSWLDPSLYKVEYSPELAKKTMEEKTAEGKIVREKPVSVGDEIPNDSKTQADDFIKNRKNKLLELLQENPILQIFGHSGVGKSSLLREIAKTDSTQPSDVAVYNELSSIEAWAQDKSEGKTKILVIDEFNVDGSTNFTMFRDLANNPKQFPQTIFHDGKSVTLTEKHKVVFLGNPPNYGNRYSQKLFEDCQIPEWHLQDFPIPYIYENILAKPIYEGLSAEYKRKLSQEDFKEIALEEIKNYKAKNQGDPQTKDILPSETVRELQEKVLKEIVKKISPIEASQVKNANFIATEVNQQNITKLQSAIEIRKLQKSGKLPPQYLGTCGVIFEGDSGVGKSVMIEAVLENRGITRIDNLENLKQEIEKERKLETEITPATKPHYYYKIPASLPIEEIEKNLIKAFELGVIVVFDEMNTRIKEGGLEKTINALLTGQHPTNPQIKPQAGFMLIASVNKATNAGRSKISPAILYRMRPIKAESLSKYKAQDFEEIIGNWEENEGKQKEEIEKEEISFTEKPNQTEIKEASEAIKKIVETQPEKLKNLRELQKIILEVLRELKVQNNELSRAPSGRE